VRPSVKTTTMSDPIRETTYQMTCPRSLCNLLSQRCHRRCTTRIVPMIGIRLACLTAWGLAVMACHSGEPAPSAPSVDAPRPTGLNLEVPAGAHTVGESEQLTVFVTLSDTTRQDITAKVSWTSSDERVATISSTGLLTIVGFGETGITAKYVELTATARILVPRSIPPRPSFTITGRAHGSAPTEHVPLAGARVEIVGDTPLAGQVLTTDAQGRFSLPPVLDAGFAIKVKKPGYEDVQRDIVMLPRDQQLDIDVPPVRSVLNVAVSGRNDCVDLPSVHFSTLPGGNGFSWGGRVYARLPIHHDGIIRVASSGLVLPFSIGCCPGYLTRLHRDGRGEYWRGVDVDTDLPVEGGFVYLITFTGDVDHCQAWGMNATAPN
jgi:hypothetical protein